MAHSFCVSSCISFLVILYTSCNSQIPPTHNTTDADYYIASEISGNLANTSTAFQDSAIYCGGSKDCHIVCDTPNSCKYTTIHCYYGLCNITCSAEHSCFGTMITDHPNKKRRYSSNQVTLTCTSNENKTDAIPICSSLSFQYTIQYPSNLYIYANHQYAIYNSTFFANNSYNIKLIVSGALAYSGNTLYGQDVSQSIGITCASDRDSACHQSNWYIPTPVVEAGDAGYKRDSRDYTFVKCYGRGCKNMGNIFVTMGDVHTNIDWKMNGCGQCESFEECLDSLTFHCDQQMDNKHQETFNASIGDSSTYFSYKCTGSYCSLCYWLKKYVNDSFENDQSDQNCYTPIEVEPEGSSGSHGSFPLVTVIVVVIVSVVLVAACVCFFVCRKVVKSYENSRPVQQQTMEPIQPVPTQMAQQQILHAAPMQQVPQQQIMYIQPMQQAGQQQMVQVPTQIGQQQIVMAPTTYNEAPPSYNDVSYD